jgi:3-hydroxyisobutyrate dehydrogenase-like beta-hydroxyacid dehydrogenase
MPKYGFLGLGIMGTGMAANLVRAGFEVTVWNRSAEKTAPLVALGARAAATPKEVVEASEITFAILSDPAAAEAVCFGADGVLEGLRDGRGYVDMSTVDAGTSRRIAAAVAGRGGRFVEAPVSGTKKPAEDGTLVILAAGDQSLFDEALPAFGKMGKKTMYLGETGNGAHMKLIINMIMGGMMTLLCEGIALGEKTGLKPAEILDALDAGALANPMFKGKGGMILAENYATNFPLKHMQKDLRLAVQLGDEAGQPLHGVSAANEVFKRACGQGLGDEDLCAVYKTIKG